MNEIAFKSEYIFMMYDDIIRTHTPSVIKQLLTMKSEYKDFIDYSKIENKTDKELMWLSQLRTSYNILEYLAKKPFDYEITLMNICRSMDNVYKDSTDMVMGKALNILLKQSFVKKIYIYAPDNDVVYADISTLCSENRDNVVIISGEFTEAINNIKDHVTLYVVNDVYMADVIMADEKRKYADILIGEYGYNYKLDPEKKIPVLKSDDIVNRALDKGYRITMFMPTNRENIGK